MNIKEIGRDSLYHSSPSLINRVQALLAMLVFFLLVFALISGPAWLPLVVDRLVGR
jgi:hypothetical protein